MFFTLDIWNFIYASKNGRHGSFAGISIAHPPISLKTNSVAFAAKLLGMRIALLPPFLNTLTVCIIFSSLLFVYANV